MCLSWPQNCNVELVQSVVVVLTLTWIYRNQHISPQRILYWSTLLNSNWTLSFQWLRDTCIFDIRYGLNKHQYLKKNNEKQRKTNYQLKDRLFLALKQPHNQTQILVLEYISCTLSDTLCCHFPAKYNQNIDIKTFSTLLFFVRILLMIWTWTTLEYMFTLDTWIFTHYLRVMISSFHLKSQCMGFTC